MVCLEFLEQKNLHSCIYNASGFTVMYEGKRVIFILRRERERDNTHVTVVFFFYRMMKERYFKLLFIYVSSLHHVYSGGTPPMKKGKF